MEQFNPGQIKKSIKQLKQRQEQYLYYLGQLAYQAGEQGKLEDAGMLEAYRTLKEIQTRLAQGEAALVQIKAAKEAAQKPRCPQCGEPLPKGAVFCAKCGAGLAAAAAPLTAPAQAGRVCPACGAPLDEDAVFCGNCGARTGGEKTAAAAQPTPQGAAAAPAAEAPATAIEETIACPKCGAVTSEADVLFCSVCGANLTHAGGETGTVEAGASAPPQGAAAAPAAEAPATAIEETIACPKCGAVTSEADVLFCSVCGTKVR